LFVKRFAILTFALEVSASFNLAAADSLETKKLPAPALAELRGGFLFPAVVARAFVEFWERGFKNEAVVRVFLSGVFESA